MCPPPVLAASVLFIAITTRCIHYFRIPSLTCHARWTSEAGVLHAQGRKIAGVYVYSHADHRSGDGEAAQPPKQGGNLVGWSRASFVASCDRTTRVVPACSFIFVARALLHGKGERSAPIDATASCILLSIVVAPRLNGMVVPFPKLQNSACVWVIHFGSLS